MSAQLQKILSTLFANAGTRYDDICGGMVPAISSLTDEDQAFLCIPLGVYEISKRKIGAFTSPVLSNLYLDFMDCRVIPACLSS